MKLNLAGICLCILLGSCKSSHFSKKITKNFDTTFYDNHFTGLLVFNPKTNDTIISYNSDKYFTPASNTKIFTLFTALSTLSDSIPAFKYHTNKDTITIIGTGNPAFLHSFFNDSTALEMGEKFKKVNIVTNNLLDDKFGPGWAWEDYDTYFSAERSSFPIYGNVLTVSNENGLQSNPQILNKNITYSEKKFRRNFNQNKFYYKPTKRDTIEIPMVIDSMLTAKLWKSILPNKVSFIKRIPENTKTVYSIPSDSLYKRMMLVSDNFLAEQMLILASSTISDTLSSSKIRKHILKNNLKDLKQKPRWVDGSGLSRYNLFTPQSFVHVLTKLYNEIPSNRLLNLFPVGGKSGTLKKWYAGNPRPYIYAKSGTLGNNYSLSGYLITNKGETLIFSFMNNHYRKSTSEIKKRMQSAFEYLRDNY